MNRGKQIGCIGNFDGLHIGHQKLLQVTQNYAAKENLKPILVTFEKHTRIDINQAQFLTTSAQRDAMIHAIGIEKIVELAFPGSIASMSPRDFVEKILLQSLQMTHVVIGENFCFGNRRSGNVITLIDLGKELQLKVSVVPIQKWNDKTICSSQIREYVQAGEIQNANAMLGYSYFVQGIVVPGKKRGRTMGIPTANIVPSHFSKLLPSQGVYITSTIIDETVYPSVTHIGPKPTFEEEEPVIETYLLTNDGDFYHKKMIILWHERVRGILHFSSKEELVQQVNKDIQTARNSFRDNEQYLVYPSIIKRLHK